MNLTDAADLHQQGQSRSWLQVRVRNSCTVTPVELQVQHSQEKAIVVSGLVAGVDLSGT